MVNCTETKGNVNPDAEDPLWKNSSWTFHRLGLALSALFSLISVVIAFYLIFRHATHYLKPWEQRHIIRILLMIPIYSCVSFLSYYFYEHAIYFEVLRDCYEAFAIASFFTLLCNYIAPNLHEQKDYFRTSVYPIKNWFWGVFGLQKCTGGENKGILRKPRSGLTWFNVIWIGVFQYCFIRVLFTIVSVITQATDRYCESSLNPEFAHIWVMAFESASVTVAMFCLIQFYLQLKDTLREYKPFLKVLCIKLVIFFSFWQSLVISFLSSSTGPLKETKKISYQDINVGLPSLLLCIEMAIFAVMHLFAFPWKPYDLSRYPDPLTAPTGGYSGEGKYQGGWLGVYAMIDAFNPWDIVKASGRGFRWLFVGRRKRFEDISYTGKIDGAGIQPPLGDATVPDYPATELQPSGDGRGPRTGTYASVEEDTAGLLTHARSHGEALSPERTRASTDEYGDLRTRQPIAQPSAQAFGGFDFGDAVYHKSPYIPPSPAADTEYRGAQGLGHSGDAEWNHWAGAQRGDASDEQSLRPPTYRTREDR